MKKLINLLVIITFLTSSSPIFAMGCLPKFPEREGKKKKSVITSPPAIEVPKITKTIEKKAKPVIKPAIIKVVKGENKWKVKLNKKAAQLIKDKKAKVRVFIAYCYYESEAGVVSSNGEVEINIEWHPPFGCCDTKVGVSLFQQTDNPDVGSGVTYCSAVTRV